MSDKKDLKNQLIIEDYYTKYNYPSVDKLLKLLKADGIIDVTKKEIQEQLSTKQEVQQFKETKKSKQKLGHITAVGPQLQVQLDIYYMQKYYKANKNFKYILACIDIFTRKLYCVAIKLKKNDDVIEGLETIFKTLGYPFIITSDSDSTFLSDECQTYFEKHNINHLTVPVGDHAALGLIDRVARTLKTILNKRFIIFKTTNWIDILPTIVEQYNNSPHVSIDDIKPNDANIPENVSKIVDINNEKRDEITTFKNEFEPNDKVRIKLEGFNKKTEGQYSDEVYIIEKIIGKTILLNNGVKKKYDMLLKVADDAITIINPIKSAKKNYKRELLHKKLNIKDDNIINTKRIVKKSEKLN